MNAWLWLGAIVLTGLFIRGMWLALKSLGKMIQEVEAEIEKERNAE